MISKDKLTLLCFVDYANDTEGMKFVIVPTSNGKWRAKPADGTKYATKVLAAVQRNFRQEFGR